MIRNDVAINPLPVRAHERLALLDAIRGAALGGILLANLMSFFGADLLSAEARRAMAWGDAGEGVLFAVNWLVEGKFYSIFSMLLGVGFVLQADRAVRRGEPRDRFDRFFRRRMTVLIAIGLTHMFALWSGDILTLYGILGLALPSLARLRGPARVGTIALLFAIPTLTHAAVIACHGTCDPRPPFAAIGAAVRSATGLEGVAAIDAFARGPAADYWAWNSAFAVARPGTYLQSGRPAKVLGLFLLGVWLAQTILPRLAAHRRALIATLVVGGVVGSIASADYASIKAATGSTFLPSAVGLRQTVAYTLGTTPLALAYLAAAALAWAHAPGLRRALQWFVPLGRMALSVYVTQTLLQLLLFAAPGAGLAGRIPFVFLPVVAAAVLSTQRACCVWWLQRHTHGPAEWLWRRGTYGSAVHL
mgnify:CR=1 FL=1